MNIRPVNLSDSNAVNIKEFVFKEAICLVGSLALPNFSFSRINKCFLRDECRLRSWSFSFYRGVFCNAFFR